MSSRSLSAASTSDACNPVDRARTASRAPRGSCACTASSRSTTSSTDVAGRPASSCAARRSRATTARSAPTCRILPRRSSACEQLAGRFLLCKPSPALPRPATSLDQKPVSVVADQRVQAVGSLVGVNAGLQVLGEEAYERPVRFPTLFLVFVQQRPHVRIHRTAARNLVHGRDALRRLTQKRNRATQTASSFGDGRQPLKCRSLQQGDRLEIADDFSVDDRRQDCRLRPIDEIDGLWRYRCGSRDLVDSRFGVTTCEEELTRRVTDPFTGGQCLLTAPG